MTTADEINRRARERHRLRQRIVQGLAKDREPGDLPYVGVPRDLIARMEALAQRLGTKRGVRGVTAVLLAIALDEAEEVCR